MYVAVGSRTIFELPLRGVTGSGCDSRSASRWALSIAAQSSHLLIAVHQLFDAALLEVGAVADDRGVVPEVLQLRVPRP